MRTKFFIALLVVSLAAPAAAQHGSQPLHQHFDDAERWSQVFDDPARDAWQKPKEVIRALALPPDASVADIGAGTGYFSVRLARAVPEGRVYAVDVSPSMVHYLATRATREHLPNLIAHQANPDDARLPRAVDLVLLVDTYHHIADRATYFRKLRTTLTGSGRLAIIDFRPGAPAGPRQGRVAPDTVKAELARAGYRLAAERDFLPYQYFLVFAPAGS
ncbi:MAG: class I SAM-dependent methyltransferase [Betaproteobacteria bacterium]|jgi:SAM-dependent methyltransferase|nr:class I SAM-dependent methyltransferase [Betaproteobacteria bacterium]